VLAGAAPVTAEIRTVQLVMDELAARLEGAFPGELTDVRVQEPDTVVAVVDRAKLKAVGRRLHDLPEIPFDSLTLISSVDYVTHFECVYHLYSFAANRYLELHVRIPRGRPVVDTVCDIWPSANWHEREAWDMMGIRFEGHPDLRRILLKDDWIGHPLRKDYVDLIENHPYV
jgi:NADH-quinone oxidoreductase subunit C